ncbi:unnamed protein product [Lactuca saligna]|uniref:Peroxiredoxin Q, chloroplastic n=1 Tax=Lactuca saligna TaxID=75948 RepID=A0AA36A6R8_LACSI|nr:unnamed protein product [Lactuca saligna]
MILDSYDPMTLFFHVVFYPIVLAFHLLLIINNCRINRCWWFGRTPSTLWDRDPLPLFLLRYISLISRSYVYFNISHLCVSVFAIAGKQRACAFRDSYEKFKKAGAQVIGISGDDAESHKAFAKKYRLPFTLLSDEGNKVRIEWGVPSDPFGTLLGSQKRMLDVHLSDSFVIPLSDS